MGFTVLESYNVLVRHAIPHHPFAIHDPVVSSALSLLLVGLAIRTWSAGTLNKSREITQVGPYALVRNPLYIGSFMMMIAFCLLCNDWLTLAFVVGPMSFLYWLQVQSEEQKLSDIFVSQWDCYAKKTPRFIPTNFSRAAFSGWSTFEWFRNREYRAIAASLIGLLCIVVWRWARLS